MFSLPVLFCCNSVSSLFQVSSLPALVFATTLISCTCPDVIHLWPVVRGCIYSVCFPCVTLIGLAPLCFTVKLFLCSQWSLCIDFEHYFITQPFTLCFCIFVCWTCFSVY